MHEINHIDDFFIKTFGKDNIHELVPTDFACLIRQLVYPLVPIHKLRLHVSLHLRIIILIFKEFLEIKPSSPQIVPFPQL